MTPRREKRPAAGRPRMDPSGTARIFAARVTPADDAILDELHRREGTTGDTAALRRLLALLRRSLARKRRKGP